MSAFNERSFAQRWAEMGDMAEAAFTEVYEAWGLKYQRFGWDRTEVSLRGVPDKIKNVPDFFTNKGLVECMGVGRDQVFKLKTRKLYALLEWHQDYRCDLFVFDSHHRLWAFVRIPDLVAATEGMETSHFHDGPEYLPIPVDQLPVTDAGWRRLPSDGWVPRGDSRS